MKLSIVFLAISLFTNLSFASDELKACTQTEVNKTTELMTIINNLAVSYQEGSPSLAESQALKQKCDSYAAGWTRDARNLLVPCVTDVTFANGVTQTLVLPRSEIGKPVRKSREC